MSDEALPRRKFLVGAGLAGASLAGTAVATGLTQSAAADPQTPAARRRAEYRSRRRRNSLSRFLSSMRPSTLSSSPRSIRSFPPTNCRRPAAIAAVRSISTANWPAPGAAARKSYRSGPFFKGKPEQGYQLALTPAEFFSAGIAAANDWSRKTYGHDFDGLPPDKRAEALKAMQEGKAEFANFSSKAFFARLLTLTMEGFFGDPIYGGNRNKVSWKMLGFPGLPATYANVIDEYRDKRYVAEPQSIADFS